jgi:phosphoglycerate dehydrogenase-like enzyme
MTPLPLPLHVHLHHPPADNHREELEGLLDPGVVLTVGAEPPDPARYSVLVSGRPSQELLDASSHLEALVIPFAGVPEPTRHQMLARPELAVHNLHHNAVPSAEMAMALLLAAAKHLIPCDRSLRAGDWTPRYDRLESLLLEGRTAVVVGYGAIGRRVCASCQALGMRVLAVRRTAPKEGVDREPEVYGADDLAALLPQAKVLVVAVPLCPATHGLLGENELDLLPPRSVVVNVSRGPVIDEEALYDRLADGRIMAAGIDVWWQYPAPEERDSTHPSRMPYHELDNVVLSPHRAGSTDRTESLRMQHLARVLNAKVAGEEMPNRVDPVHGY